MHHVVVSEEPCPPCQLEVESSQRRTLIARDEHSRLPARAPVEPDPIEQHPDQGLDAGQVDRAVLTQVAIIQRKVFHSEHPSDGWRASSNSVR